MTNFDGVYTSVDDALSFVNRRDVIAPQSTAVAEEVDFWFRVPLRGSVSTRDRSSIKLPAGRLMLLSIITTCMLVRQNVFAALETGSGWLAELQLPSRAERRPHCS